jgi:hypothetical protein
MGSEEEKRGVKRTLKWSQYWNTFVDTKTTCEPTG